MSQNNTIRFRSEVLPIFTAEGFQPVLEIFCQMLEKHDLQPIDTIEDQSVIPLSRGINESFLKGFFKPYRMEKCEKLCLSNCMLMDRILVCAVIAIPHDDYEFPMLVLEWSETENTISLVVDLIPLADLVMREGYRQKYLDQLDPLWTKYKMLPGMEPNRFAWSRMLFSPYYLSGAISKENDQHKQDCLDIIKNYFEVWLNHLQNAQTIGDQATRVDMKERKTKIRQIFRINDEGAKTMSQMVGQEVIDTLLLCNF